VFNIEPSAAHRTAASELFQMKMAYVQAGFTELEAMQLICAILAASVSGAK